MVSLLGNASQGSYCAANIFLNLLADYRHKMGLSATAIQYGPISESGYLARNTRVLELWEEKWFSPQTPREAHDALGRVLIIRPTQIDVYMYKDTWTSGSTSEIKTMPWWLKVGQSRYKLEHDPNGNVDRFLRRTDIWDGYLQGTSSGCTAGETNPYDRGETGCLVSTAKFLTCRLGSGLSWCHWYEPAGEWALWGEHGACASSQR